MLLMDHFRRAPEAWIRHESRRGALEANARLDFIFGNEPHDRSKSARQFTNVKRGENASLDERRRNFLCLARTGAGDGEQMASPNLIDTAMQLHDQLSPMRRLTAYDRFHGFDQGIFTQQTNDYRTVLTVRRYRP